MYWLTLANLALLALAFQNLNAFVTSDEQGAFVNSHSEHQSTLWMDGEGAVVRTVNVLHHSQIHIDLQHYFFEQQGSHFRLEHQSHIQCASSNL